MKNNYQLKNAKRFLLPLLLVVTLFMVSCGSSGKGGKGDNIFNQSTEAGQTEAQEKTDAPAQTDAPTQTDAQAQTEDNTAKGTEVNAQTTAAQGTDDARMQWQFTSTALDGKPVDEKILADYKVTLVNVWATYCGPCLHEMPMLSEAGEHYKDKGVGFLGIVSDAYEDDENMQKIARDIVKDNKIGYTNIIGSESVKTTILSGIRAVPTTFFVDSNGYLVGKVVEGSLTRSQLDNLVEIALKEVGE